MSESPSSMRMFLKILLAIIAAQLLWIEVAAAANGMPDALVAYPGSYEVNDFGTTPSACAGSNLLSSACWCPGATGSAQAFRIINDALGAGSRVGGYVHACTSGVPLTASEYQGGYQQDDPAPGGLGCRTANASTGSCVCPAGTNTVWVRLIVDGSAGIIGSHIGICVKPTAAPKYFGGAYQLDDPVAGGQGCRAGNPLTAGCSCPAGFRPQAHRIQADSSNGFIGSTMYTCVATIPATQICPGQYADLTGATSANAAVQACMSATATGGALDLPAGSYRMDGQVQPKASTSIRTVGATGTSTACTRGIPCAVLLAAPSFNTTDGFMGVVQSGVTLDHLVLDGNRSARIGSTAQQQCKGGNNHAGYNAIAHAASFSFIGSASVNALCGTGMELIGDNAVISGSVFNGNGDHYTTNTWSDGLTALSSNGMKITNSYFGENSDVSLVIGGSKNAIVQNNTVYQSQNRAFAGMMLDNFNGSQPSDFSGTVVSNNTITCNNCDFAMNLGPHPWYLSSNIYGGTVTANYIRGGSITLNVDGAGTSSLPLWVYSNDLGAAHTITGGPCGVNSRLNISPDSVMKSGSTAPDTRYYVHQCP